MFKYAVYPAQLIALLAFVVFALSFFLNAFKNWQRPALALVATMAIGAGLITHTIFKDHWGRPRPKQIVEFGGHQAFRPYYQPNFFHQPEPSKSFPCGHCTMGFYFFSVALLFRRLGHLYLFYFFFLFAIGFGTAFGISRMMMGAHYFSDVLVTGIIMWLTAYIFDQTLCNHWEINHERPYKTTT
jgi:membrane-associated PAP2 superfamily phosphatase